MSEPASISIGIAKRYATAVFELSKESKSLKSLEADVDALELALSQSAELRTLLVSPVYPREQVAQAVTAIAKTMKLSQTVSGTLGLMASNRRLFALPHVLAALRDMLASEKGEVTAEVLSAKPLTTKQEKDLIAALKARVGKGIKLELAIDKSLIGGLVIKVGSQMIDTSIRAQLAALKNSMKEVG